MKLDFDSYPLDIYNRSTIQSFLKSIEVETPYYRLSNLSVAEFILSSFVKKVAGAKLLSWVDHVSIGLKGRDARKCLSSLISEQAYRISLHPSSLLDEAQVNIMATSCVTGQLASLESASWSNGAKNIGKALLGLLDFKNPLDTICESVLEISKKYDEICLVYHIAFLLNVYATIPSTMTTVKKLIIESLCDDNYDDSSFSSKTRPILFSNVQYKNLEENLKYRLYALNVITNSSNELSPFIEWRKELNSY